MLTKRYPTLRYSSLSGDEIPAALSHSPAAPSPRLEAKPTIRRWFARGVLYPSLFATILSRSAPHRRQRRTIKHRNSSQCFSPELLGTVIMSYMLMLQEHLLSCSRRKSSPRSGDICAFSALQSFDFFGDNCVSQPQSLCSLVSLQQIHGKCRAPLASRTVRPSNSSAFQRRRMNQTGGGGRKSPPSAPSLRTSLL